MTTSETERVAAPRNVFQGAPLDVAARTLSTSLIAMLMRPIEVIAAALMFAVVVLVLAGVFFRYVLSHPLIWIDEITSLSFIWMGMLGAVIASSRSEHIRLNLFVSMFPAVLLPLVQATSTLLVAIFLASLVAPSLEHASFESIMTSPELGISKFYYILAIATGVALMLVITLLQLFRDSDLKRVAISVAVVATLFAVLWLSRDHLAELGKYNIVLFLVAGTAVCLTIGVPIAFCFGIGTLAFLFFTTHIPMTVMVGRIDEGVANPVLLSVPVFILLGCILDSTGMGKAIVEFLSSMIGHVRGGMSYVLLGSLYLVSGISGSKVSDMATVAPALFPEMKRRGNKPSEMVALLATGAIMADTVPPSIVLIVLGSVAGLSIGALFTSGFVIALFLLLILAAVARWRSGRESLQGVSRAPLALVLRTMVVAAPALVLPFLIRGAVGGGVATATEVSAVAVLYAYVIGFLLYGGGDLRNLLRMLVDTASLSGSILLIMGTALATAWALTQTGFAFQLSGFMKSLPGGWISFMFVTILIFVVLGCLLEGLPALVLLAPIMFPIATGLGINGIHYGMVVVVALNIGMFTPPIGVGYYLACGIGKVAPESALRSIWIYLLALVIGLLFIALVPALSIAYL